MTRTQDQGRVAKASRLYHSGGLSVREVAKVMDVDEKTVRRWLGDSLRRRGPRGRTDVTDARVIALRDQDMNPTDIARATGLSRSAVRKRLARLSETEGRPGSQPAQDSSEGEQER